MNNQLLKEEKIRSERAAGETQSLYQISTSTALVEGVHSGSVSSAVLLEHGDFGLGTFEGLDGEMVILDGQIYQVTDRVRHRTDDFLVPFASITHFRAKSSFEIDERFASAGVGAQANSAFPTIFYAAIDGAFDHSRACRYKGPKNTSGYWTRQKRNPVSFLSNTEARSWLRCPRHSSSSASPGYHFHFISKVGTKGRSSVDQPRSSARVRFCQRIQLPDSGPS
jgi:acetolactate decarboxylase